MEVQIACVQIHKIEHLSPNLSTTAFVAKLINL